MSRMKLRGTSVRFLVVSATVPNLGDVADWVGNASGKGSAIVKNVRNTRPAQTAESLQHCSLEKITALVGYQNSCTEFPVARTPTTSFSQRRWTIDCMGYYNSTAVTSPSSCFVRPAKVSALCLKSNAYSYWQGVMNAAEHVLKEYEEAIAKKEHLPWSKPSRYVE